MGRIDEAIHHSLMIQTSAIVRNPLLLLTGQRDGIPSQIQRAPSMLRDPLISQRRQNLQTRGFDRHAAARFGPSWPTFVDPQMR
jgi:hypothetical protein